jgi:hypothetical protein
MSKYTSPTKLAIPRIPTLVRFLTPVPLNGRLGLCRGFHLGLPRSLVHGNVDFPILCGFLTRVPNGWTVLVNSRGFTLLMSWIALSLGLPKSRSDSDFPKWEISHVPPSLWTAQIYPGVFIPIHWDLNPRVTPDRSNGCRVFQSRSDGSDRLLPGHSSMTPWTWKNQRSRYSHGPWRSTIRNSSLPTKTQKTKG